MRPTLHRLGFCLALLTCAIVRPIPPPPAPRAEVHPLSSRTGKGAGDVARHWKAQNTVDDRGAIDAKRSTPPAIITTIGGRRVLTLSCDFATTDIPRCVWDRQVNLDLTHATAVCFDVYGEDLTAIGRIDLYLGSGQGWFGAEWYPRESDRWCRVRIPLAAFGIDHAGGSWSRIERWRFSPWRNAPGVGTLHVANIAIEEATAPVAVLGPESRADTKWCNNVMQLLDDIGAPVARLAAGDLSRKRLADLKVLILPYGRMSAETAAMIAEFARNGGTLIACFSLPGPVAAVLGVNSKSFRGAKPRGEFASVRFVDSPPPPGAPRKVDQASWGVIDAAPVRGVSRVWAWWYDSKGKSTGVPAIIRSDHGVWFSHVLLTDDPENKGRLLLALLEEFVPGTASRVGVRRLGMLGRRLGCPDWKAANELVRAQPAFRAETSARVAEANKLVARARNDKDPFEQLRLCDRAENALIRAYASSQRWVSPEFRAAWCHPTGGVAGWGWPKTAKRLAEAGIGHLFLNALHGASAAYPSKVLAMDKANAPGENRLAQATDACAEYGIKVHVWMTNFKVGGHAPDATLAKLKAVGRMAVQVDGKVTDTLCPSNPENQRLQIEAMIEAARRPGVAGIHFDYIRYPNANTCFCDGCRHRFEGQLGKPVKDWPADVLPGGRLREDWLRFRCDNITRVVRETSRRVREVRPHCLISAAVFNSYPNCVTSVAQDWRLWAEKGYVDFLCPMNYTASNAQFRAFTRSQLAILKGRVPCYPGIGLLKGQGAVGALQQIEISRELRTGGFVVWSVFAEYMNDVFPFLGKQAGPEQSR